MLNPTNVLKLNEEHQKATLKEKERFRESYKFLDSYNRLKVERLEELINGIIALISKDSLWQFTPPNIFSFRENFSFNHNTEQIVFTTHTVSSNDKSYISKNNSSLELSFINKYQKYLNKLFRLQQKKDKILNSVNHLVEEEKTKVISFYSHDKRSNGSEFFSDYNVTDYLCFRAKLFMESFQLEGLFSLLKLLNDLSYYHNPIELYNELRESDMHPLLLNAIVDWAGVYTYPAQVILDYMEQERAIYSTNRIITKTHY